LDGRFEKLTVDDPRGVVNKPMMRTRMKMPDMVAVKRIRGGVTGILLHTLLIHTYFAVSRERERERERERAFVRLPIVRFVPGDGHATTSGVGICNLCISSSTAPGKARLRTVCIQLNSQPLW
jgi:hypothetical protein